MSYDPLNSGFDDLDTRLASYNSPQQQQQSDKRPRESQMSQQQEQFDEQVDDRLDEVEESQAKRIKTDQEESDENYEEQDDAEKDDQGLRTNAIGLIMRHMTSQEPTVDTLPQEVLDRAHVSAAAYEYEKGGFEQAREYLDSNGMEDWHLDNELSNDREVVVIDPKTNKPVMGVRGTKIDWKKPKQTYKDLKADYDQYAGQSTDNERFQHAEETFQKAGAKYNALPSEMHVTGHSLGGGVASHVGHKFGADTTGFNAWSGKEAEFDPNQTTKNLQIRVVDDPVSTFNGYSKSLDRDATVHSVLPNHKGINPLKSHGIDNFTKGWKRNPRYKYKTLMENWREHQGDLFEKKMLNEANRSVKSGKTFTEHMQEVNLTVTGKNALERMSQFDSTESGEFPASGVNNQETVLTPNDKVVINGKNVPTDNMLVRAWADAKGQFTDEEIDAIKGEKIAEPGKTLADETKHDVFLEDIQSQHKDNPKHGLSNKERKDFIRKSQEAKNRSIGLSNEKYTAAMNDLHDSDFHDIMEDFGENTAVQDTIPRSQRTENIRTLLNPKNLLGGYAASVAVDKLVDDFGPFKKNTFSSDLAKATLTGGVIKTGGRLLGKIKSGIERATTMFNSDQVAEDAATAADVETSTQAIAGTAESEGAEGFLAKGKELLGEAGEFVAEKGAEDPFLALEGTAATGAGEAGAFRTSLAAGLGFATTYATEKGLDAGLKKLGIDGDDEGSRFERDAIAEPLGDAAGAVAFLGAESGGAGLLIAPEVAGVAAVIGEGAVLWKHRKFIGEKVEKAADKVGDFFKGLF